MKAINIILCLVFISLSCYYDNWFIMLAFISGEVYIAFLTSDYPRPSKNMSTKEEIASIIKEQYSDYKGRYNERLKPIHERIRKQEGDLGFLEFLKDAKAKNPRPKYEEINI